MKYSGNAADQTDAKAAWDAFYDVMEKHDQTHGHRCNNKDCDILLHETKTGRREIRDPQSGKVLELCSDCFYKKMGELMPQDDPILPAPVQRS